MPDQGELLELKEECADTPPGEGQSRAVTGNLVELSVIQTVHYDTRVLGSPPLV